MRGVVIVGLLSACGRLDFDSTPTQDARSDVALDAVDASGGDPEFRIWLKMEDDPADGQLDDNVGSHVATCTVGTTCGTATPGRVGGQALYLDGNASQCYSIANAADLVTPVAFSAAVWVRIDAVTSRPVIVTKRFDLVHNAWAIYVDTGSTNYWSFETATSASMGAYDFITPMQPVEVGVWKHIAVTWDGTTKRGYVDGVKLLEYVPPAVMFDNAELLIGCDQDDNGTGRLGFVTGAIDDVRVWSRMLSDTEIQSLAQ